MNEHSCKWFIRMKNLSQKMLQKLSQKFQNFEMSEIRWQRIIFSVLS